MPQVIIRMANLAKLDLLGRDILETTPLDRFAGEHKEDKGHTDAEVGLYECAILRPIWSYLRSNTWVLYNSRARTNKAEPIIATRYMWMFRSL